MGKNRKAWFLRKRRLLILNYWNYTFDTQNVCHILMIDKEDGRSVYIFYLYVSKIVMDFKYLVSIYTIHTFNIKNSLLTEVVRYLCAVFLALNFYIRYTHTDFYDWIEYALKYNYLILLLALFEQFTRKRAQDNNHNLNQQHKNTEDMLIRCS